MKILPSTDIIARIMEQPYVWHLEGSFRFDGNSSIHFTSRRQGYIHWTPARHPAFGFKLSGDSFWWNIRFWKMNPVTHNQRSVMRASVDLDSPRYTMPREYSTSLDYEEYPSFGEVWDWDNNTTDLAYALSYQIIYELDYGYSGY